MNFCLLRRHLLNLDSYAPDYKTLLSLSITIVTNIKQLANISDTLMQVQYEFKIFFAFCQGTCM